MTAALLALNSRTFSSLKKHRNYRLYFSGQIVSVTGTWMQDTALPWLILGLTHSPCLRRAARSSRATRRSCSSGCTPGCSPTGSTTAAP